MSNILKQFLYIVAICAIVICALGINYNWNWWNKLSYIVSVASISFFIYSKWVWRIIPTFITHMPILPQKIKIIFEYEHPYTKQHEFKEATMIISQTLLSIRIVVKTNEMKSVSISANIREENGDYILYYIYRTDPKNKFVDQNPSKYGAARVDLSGLPKLEGKYWTTLSKGDLYSK